MLTCTVLVIDTAGTEEHHFATLDRHRCDTYETLHNLQLVLHSHISIIAIEVSILVIQAIIQNPTVRLLLLKDYEFLKIDMPHHRFYGIRIPPVAVRASFIVKLEALNLVIASPKDSSLPQP
jgi:hypothetical protein